MLRRVNPTWLATLVVLIACGAIVGAVSAPQGGGRVLAGVLAGVGVAILVATVLYVHLSVRTLFGKTPESGTPELARDSIEREVVRRAGERSFPDIISISLLGALVAPFIESVGMLRAIPIVLAVASIIDFVLRAYHEWKALVADDDEQSA